MKQLFFYIMLFAAGRVEAQVDTSELLYAFRINEYMVPLSDSVMVVQVQLPDASPIIIRDKQIGILKHRYESGSDYDTSLIGWGRCHLIKGDFYYFSIHHENGILPQQGDLLYTRVKVPVQYKGMLFSIASKCISFTKVNETQFYYNMDVFYNDNKWENEVIDSMINDIKYTGRVMKEQMDNQDQVIKGGIYDGKKLFIAMQSVKREELIEFMKYVIATPAKYAGNVWKISEVFATWMVNNTPTAEKNW